MPISSDPYGNPVRREFVKSSTLTTASTLAIASQLYPAVHTAGDDTLRIGLIGCGGRGAGAASQALMADGNVKLVAMGDAFEDRLQVGLKSLLTKKELESKIDVPVERQFVGFDAYQKVIDSGVDVVLLTTPPHFRPIHLAAAVAAGKHVFAEKPCAVDTPGVHSVLRSCEEATKKNLSVVSGLCLRYHAPYRAAVQRIQDGAIGEIRTLMANDYRGPIWIRTREPDWTEMHWQMRNWYYYTWLSGDFNVEQHVHNLDVCAWSMGDQYPIKAIGMGGREVRKGPEYGNIFDHHSVVYEYANGARLISNTRQIAGCKSDISVHILGSRGTASLTERNKGVRISAREDWTYDEEAKNLYQVEHDELFASIRAGTPVNNGEYMAKSTLLAIMGRMATYTGQEITWDMAWKSKEDLTPPRYEWGDIAAPAIAVPGETKFA
ncbi:MAG: Gfo/Idh/MocA family oxidoreductase [Pirellulaceae bacterium]|nr:Gfo/Idh/MocA family oxidoreductase [Pirellulaceae bacterium]